MEEWSNSIILSYSSRKEQTLLSQSNIFHCDTFLKINYCHSHLSISINGTNNLYIESLFECFGISRKRYFPNFYMHWDKYNECNFHLHYTVLPVSKASEMNVLTFLHESFTTHRDTTITMHIVLRKHVFNIL